jgi:hypothetical protein
VVSVTPRQRFSPGERTPGTHCTGSWVDPRTCLDTEARGKILSPPPGIEPLSPGRPARSQTLYRLSYSGSSKILVEIINNNNSYLRFNPNAIVTLTIIHKCSNKHSSLRKETQLTLPVQLEHLLYETSYLLHLHTNYELPHTEVGSQIKAF